MTPKLKNLIAKYQDLTPGSTFTTHPRGPIHSTRLDGRPSSNYSQEEAGDSEDEPFCGEDERFGGEDEQCDGEDEQFPPMEGPACGDIDSKLEEKVARIVLKHSPGFPKASSKLLVWQAIAVDSRGRYKSASKAKMRTGVLCKVASNPHHTKYHELTPALRRLLLTIQSHCNGVTTTVNPRTTINERKDRQLMELVLRLRPFEHDGDSKSAVWAEIVASVKHPVVVDTKSAEKRVLFLIQVIDNHKHRQYTSLTERLRFLQRKYKRMVANKPNPASRSSARTPQRIAAHTTATQTQSHSIDRENQDESLSDAVETTTRQLPTPSISPPSEFIVMALADQVAKLGSEQRGLRGELRELRGELHELHGELSSQRECHHRETTAMLELLEKERQDRKDEFTAMIALLTRFGVPVGAPEATAFSRSGSNNAHSIENCLI